ncbi:protein-glutamine gamma-glutamyltransferase [Paenibacillus radicis (ex Xue et al. 2023)]|uniref:Protein-glutamine gamma-glutamyltransferase n=1 Tax=Paenibacillus radicis (ex Xue et al. 2023) TaxID=2972489 RepID=A0ABT1YNY2_9BACL|nr:protein-glutamine gamma-glutamyltransferase [Paenibacillus radicis (ex Xue et al. 2023)]MCR8634877.1 protein-glutamine gamma-glutamyltransferase [Paenibacillus radicis (ex Xue et al. 2023)]
MIVIAGNKLADFDESMLSEQERIIFQKKKSSPTEQRYETVDELIFELHMRARIVAAARLLSKSGARFASFKESRCNEDFWKLTESGGFQLKDGVTPQNAINDIFSNGKKYAFECSTAVVIVLYKAILDSIDPEEFNKLFADLLIFDWHLNSNLRLLEKNNKEEAEAGDLLYFKNPDFSPVTPWWRGENVVLLEDGKYYGHGIGIKSDTEMIAALNKYRVKDSNKSAYLTDNIKELNFNFYRQHQAKTRLSRVKVTIGGKPIRI